MSAAIVHLENLRKQFTSVSYHATLTINGRVFLGNGSTPSEAQQNCRTLVAEKTGMAGLAVVVQPIVENSNR